MWPLGERRRLRRIGMVFVGPKATAIDIRGPTVGWRAPPPSQFPQHRTRAHDLQVSLPLRHAHIKTKPEA